jgi:LAO/AO transport system kinase
MELRGMLSLNAPRAHGAGAPKAWKPPIIPTVAARQEGIDELWAAIEAHRRYLESTGMASELAERRLKDETSEVVAELAREQARQALAEDGALTRKLLADGTPYRAAEEIIGTMGARPRKAPRKAPTGDGG